MLLLVLLAGLWAAFWQAAAWRLADAAATGLDRLRQEGARAECESLAVSGFPLALRIDCRSIAYARDIDGIAAVAGPARLGWSLSAPLTLSATAQAPARLEWPGLVPLELAWQALTIRSALPFPVPSALAVSATALTGTARLDEKDRPAFALAGLAANATLRGADVVLDLAASGLVVAGDVAGGHDLPPLDLDLTATVGHGAAAWRAGRPSLRGTTLDIAALRLASGATAAVRASGTATIDRAGHVTGRLTAFLDDPETIAALAIKASPEEADTIRSAVSALEAMQQPAGVPLIFEDGEAWLGLLPLGVVPPLP